MESNSACNHVNDKKKPDDHVVGVRFANHETVIIFNIENWITKYCDLLTLSITKFKRETRHHIYIFIKKGQLHVHMTLTVRIFRHDVLTFSNYKHDVYTYPIGVQIGLVITNYIQEFCYNFD